MNLNATILGQTIAFILFVWFCMKYVWPPIINAIEKRQKEIADTILRAESAKKDFYLAQINTTNQIKQAKANAYLILEEANKRKAQIINTAKIDANIEHTKIVAQAKTTINEELNRVREELRQQISTLVIAGAEKIIERSLNNTAHSDIIDQLITHL
ncbi:ATP synthase subunit b [Candidatus Profftia lariciata]|uniref:F0F1 ATP synthase subunit B n=1 Tax=Candidatus Profftia lariciata TaxID=1987921 RepID=UPI001D018FA5|nr:F0F1 ATP synthase subunit B [Candidatus Profftia lariciata]UDG81773.1 ATP synthase subunit b [Candidatus Profftia lariciata]